RRREAEVRWNPLHGALVQGDQPDPGPSREGGHGRPRGERGRHQYPRQAERRVLRHVRAGHVPGKPGRGGLRAINERGVAPLGLGWPNIVSVSRVLLVPVVVTLIAVQTRSAAYAATGVFVAGGLTDLLDGYLARRFRTTTLTGAWLDPLSDKLLVAATVIALTAIGRFPVWAAVLILAREVAVTALRAYLGSPGRSMPAAPLPEWEAGLPG